MREGRLCSGRVDTRTTALCVTGVFVRLPRLWRAPGYQHGIRRRALSDTAAMSRAGMTCSKKVGVASESSIRMRGRIGRRDVLNLVHDLEARGAALTVLEPTFSTKDAAGP